MSRWTVPQPVILKYYAYRATRSFGFVWPIFTLFLLARGMSFTEIALLSSISAGIIIVGEVPAGYLGDRIGRRNSLLLGSTFMTTQTFGFVFVNTFSAFVVLFVAWGLTQVFWSGSGDAWLYDTLKAEIGGEHFARVRGRGGSVFQVVTGVTLLAGGVLYSIDPVYPFVANGVLSGIGVFVIISMPKNAQYQDGAEAADPPSIVETVSLIRQYFTRPALLSFVAYMGLFFGIVRAADEYIQPISTQTLQFPVASMGLLYASLTVVAAVVGYFAGDIHDWLGIRRAIVLLPGIVAVLFVLPLAIPVLALPAFVAMRGVPTAIQPIANQYLNDRIESVGRATILSVAAMVYGLVRLPLLLGSGIVADAFSPIVAVAVLGAVFLVGGVCIHLVEVPAHQPGTTDEQSVDTAGES